MGKIRLGIIGCGWVAPFHVSALNNLADQVTIEWVADTNEVRARSVAEGVTTNPTGQSADRLQRRSASRGRGVHTAAPPFASPRHCAGARGRLPRASGETICPQPG